MNSDDVEKLIHNLQVHQRELEVKNEECHRTRIELEESRDRLADLYDLAPVGYFTLDKHGIILEVNLTGAQLLGAEKGLLVNRRFTSFVDTESQDAFHSCLKELFKRGAGQSRELKMLTTDGTSFSSWIEATPVATRGDLSRCQVAVIDVTKAQYRAIFREARDGIVLVDAKTGNIINCNPEFERQTGRTLDKLRNMKIWQTRPPERMAAAEQRFHEIRKAGSGSSSELEFQKPNGDVVPVEFTSKMVTIQGKTYLQSMVRDITERKQIERDMGERLKELRCLYSISQISGRVEISLNEVCQEVANLLPPGWQYPEITCSRIIINEDEFRTENYTDADWRQCANIKVRGGKIGMVEVGYLEERPAVDEGPFLKEERALINAVADYLAGIIERKQAEEEIRDLAKFPSENPNPVLRIAKNGTILYANQVSLPLLNAWGCEIGKSLPDHLHQTILGVLRTGSPKYVEIKCGEKIFSFLFAPVVDVGYVNLYGYDITERKQADEQIKRSVEEWRATFDSITDLVSIHSRDFKIMRVNRAFADFFNTKPEEIVGKTCYKLVHKTSGPPPNCPHVKALENKRANTVEYFEPNLGLFLEMSASPLFDNKGGEVVATVHVARDITERKKVDQMKDEFISLISHELRSPLTVIMGGLNTMLSEGNRLSPQERNQLLNDAALETESLSHLVSNLLELSRAQSGRLMIHAETIKLSALVSGVVEQIKEQSDSHRFVVSIPKKLPLLLADWVRLERILYNLLENAVKYSPPGGKVKVFARRQNQYILIGISDQGEGISPENQAIIFQPFERLGDPRQEVLKGVGLGLVVCRRLVEAHGGKIWVKSKPGEGATFYLKLPTSQQQ